MELYSAGTGNGMRADCIFGVLDYDERPLLAESGSQIIVFLAF